MAKLKTIEDLQKYADDADEEISQLTSTVNEQGIQVTAFIEKLKSLQTIIKGGVGPAYLDPGNLRMESLDQTARADREFEKFLKMAYKKNANEELSVKIEIFYLRRKTRARGIFYRRRLSVHRWSTIPQPAATLFRRNGITKSVVWSTKRASLCHWSPTFP